MKPKLAESEYFAVRMDLWTSRATHPYLSCTVHFIDCSLELQPLYRETVPLFEHHTSGNITESLYHKEAIQGKNDTSKGKEPAAL